MAYVTNLMFSGKKFVEVTDVAKIKCCICGETAHACDVMSKEPITKCCYWNSCIHIRRFQR